jgi:hypothetical protein
MIERFRRKLAVSRFHEEELEMSENDEKSVIKQRTVRMADGSIRTFQSREKSRFVDNNGVECVVLEVFDPNVRYASVVMEVTGSLIGCHD